MRWLLRKCDSLTGTVLAAIGGVACAQLPVFVQQYLQRLGGHVDEARRMLAVFADADTVQLLDAAARQTVEALTNGRLRDLMERQQAILEATPWGRPLAFAQHFDRDIASATLAHFEPAIPLDALGLVYGACGMVAGWLLYDLLKVLPLALLRRRGGRRRHRPGHGARHGSGQRRGYQNTVI